MSDNNIPEGYTLDPSEASKNDAGIPAGYTLDPADNAKPSYIDAITKGFMKGIRRQQPPPEKSIFVNPAENVAYDVARYGPQVAAGFAASAATEGMSTISGVLLSALNTAGAEGFHQVLSRTLGGEAPPDSHTAALALKNQAIAGGISELGNRAMLGLAAKAGPGIRKTLAQAIKAESNVPEKYTLAVLNNPKILSEGQTIEAAGKLYGAAVKGMPGYTKYLAQSSGKLFPKAGSAEKLIEDAVQVTEDGKYVVKEGVEPAHALAARQATSFLGTLARFGNPEQRAQLSALLGSRDALDEYLEAGFPGFKKASKDYFEANAKEAFKSWVPLTKQGSPTVLRMMEAKSWLAASSLLHAPLLVLGVGLKSPRLTGYGIRTAATTGKVVSPFIDLGLRLALSKMMTVPNQK